jgi:two-component system chemotaxis sensor kinase CheA
MIDQYKQAFDEEARELLAELEAALLELDQNRGDRETVGRAFRALHTIKGSGAMFGFDDIAGFTHNLETAFDRLRNGELTATTDLIRLSLAAGDQIKSMLDEAGAAPWTRSAPRGADPAGERIFLRETRPIRSLAARAPRGEIPRGSANSAGPPHESSAAKRV